MEADPTRIRTWDTLARAVEENRGVDEAERVYQRLLEQQAERPAAHIAYTSHLARQQRGADAIEHLERVLAEGLDAAILWEQLVRLELSDGTVKEGKVKRKGRGKVKIRNMNRFFKLNQFFYLTGKTDKGPRDKFFYIGDNCSDHGLQLMDKVIYCRA